MTAASRHKPDPLTTLHARRGLDCTDPKINDALFAAGLRYRALAAAAEVRGLQSVDVSRPIVDGGRAPASDRSSTCRDKLVAADAVVGWRFLPILQGVVVEERTIDDLRTLVVEVKDRNAASAVVVDRLRGALHALCIHWQIGTSKQGPIRTWRAA